MLVFGVKLTLDKCLLAIMAASALSVAGYAFVAYLIREPGSRLPPPLRDAFQAHLWAILTHIGGSIVAIGVGWIQFVPGIRAKAALHRAVGYMYFTGIAVGGAGSLCMACYSYGGWTTHVAYGVAAVYWLLSAGLALRAAKQRDFSAHQLWMVRNYSLTLAAVSLRVYIALFRVAKVPFDVFYPIVAWSSWVGNVVVTEWQLSRILSWINRTNVVSKRA
jgi:hypothetical protein